MTTRTDSLHSIAQCFGQLLLDANDDHFFFLGRMLVKSGKEMQHANVIGLGTMCVPHPKPPKRFMVHACHVSFVATLVECNMLLMNLGACNLIFGTLWFSCFRSTFSFLLPKQYVRK